MIKIDKDVTPAGVPDSLRVPVDPNARTRATQKQRTTHKRRMEVIENKGWIDQQKFRQRYKQDDVKRALGGIYHHKCAFCEKRDERYDVEHFRPKAVYYWLAYSWDNLLLACPGCNGSKSTTFDVRGSRATCNADVIGEIHSLAAAYHASEDPMLLHPEREDPEPLMQFGTDGSIASEDARAEYTIKTCNIDRAYLRDSRKTLLDRFKQRLNSVVLTYKDEQALRKRVLEEISFFAADAFDPEQEYLGFRRYALKHLLGRIVKQSTTPP